jgi:hypothetical protein
MLLAPLPSQWFSEGQTSHKRTSGLPWGWGETWWFEGRGDAQNIWDFECEQCLRGQPVPSQPGRNILEHHQRPFLAGCRGNPTGLSCADEEGTEKRKKDNRARGYLDPLTTPTPKKGGYPRLGQSLVKQENVRPRWVLLYPSAQWPRVRAWLSSQKSILVHRHQDLVLG